MAESKATQKNFKQSVIYFDSVVCIFRKHRLAKGIISNYLFVCGLNYRYFKKSPAEILRNFDEMLEYAKKNDLEVDIRVLLKIYYHYLQILLLSQLIVFCISESPLLESSLIDDQI